MSKRARAALAAAAAAGIGLVVFTANTLTSPWEGRENHAYWDRLGKVWTVCDGETKGVKKGDYYSDEECLAKLYERLERDFHQPLTRCISGFDSMPFSWRASMLDLSYNIGAPSACKSTAAKRARAGNFKGSCEAMTWYNRAGGRVIEGLKRRREYGDKERIGELELCLAGLE